MAHLIDKDALVAEIEEQIKGTESMQPKFDQFWAGQISAFKGILKFLDTLEVKNDYLEKFKSLQHISGDLKSTLHYFGYAPNLYYFDESWHVDWISCEEGDSIKDFMADTAEEAINEAYNWFHSTFCNG